MPRTGPRGTICGKKHAANTARTDPPLDSAIDGVTCEVEAIAERVVDSEGTIAEKSEPRRDATSASVKLQEDLISIELRVAPGNAKLSLQLDADLIVRQIYFRSCGGASMAAPWKSCGRSDCTARP